MGTKSREIETPDGVAVRQREVAERSRAAFAASEFDAVVGLSVETFQYLAGYWIPYARHYPTRHNIVIWPKDAEPVLLVGLDQVDAPIKYSWIRDVRTYAPRGERPPGAIVDELATILTNLGVSSGTIGIEYLNMSVAFFDRLKSLLPGVTFEPCDEFLYQLRALKTPAEVAQISRCAVASEKGLMAAIRAARSNWTEKRFADEIRSKILEHGVDSVSLVLLGSGERAKGFLAPSNEPLEQGTFVRIDLNAVLDGYYADMGRMAVVGKPTSDQMSLYAQQLALNNSIVRFMKPGVRASDVFAHYLRAADELGVRLLDQPWIGFGHSIGVNSNDFPNLNRGEEIALAPGMIFNIEPDIIGPLGEAIHFEDMVLIEAETASVITSAEDWTELPAIL